VQPRSTRRRLGGALSTSDFLNGVLELTRARLSSELQRLETRQQGALIKLYDADPAVHFELWLHHNRARAEIGLHFETRNADRNRRLLDYVGEELMFIKATLGAGVEAEPWDKGWTRLYMTRPIGRLGPDEQTVLAAIFAEFIETLDPLRREAVAAHP
jgi:hypothetical protein